MIKHLIFRQLLWCTFTIALLIFSLGISWQVSKSNNFFYGFWYQSLQINSVISKNVRINTQGKRDFPINDVQLHEEKFADIVRAIHQQGDGLAEISYLNQHGSSQKLLTKSEVVHLQDVANLLNSLTIVWWGNLFFLLGLLIFYCRQASNIIISQGMPKAQVSSLSIMPNAKQKLIALSIFALLVIAILSVWGFTQVFYYLHTVVFPVEHQWFFYYRDSLMASIMKAPDIFAAIAAQLMLVALLLTTAIEAIVCRYQCKSGTI